MAGPPLSDIGMEFMERMRAALDTYGTRANHQTILQEFMDRGVGRTTVYRWWQTCKREYAEAQGDPDMRFPRGGGEAEPPPPPARGRKRAPPAPPKPITAGDVAARLPPVPSIDDVKTMGLLPVLELLTESIRAAQDIMKHGRLADGGVRNARLIQSGAEHLRRAVETAAKLNESVAVQQEMQAFHRIIMQEIAAEAPPLQERILNRIRRVCDNALSDG